MLVMAPFHLYRWNIVVNCTMQRTPTASISWPLWLWQVVSDKRRVASQGTESTRVRLPRWRSNCYRQSLCQVFQNYIAMMGQQLENLPWTIYFWRRAFGWVNTQWFSLAGRFVSVWFGPGTFQGFLHDDKPSGICLQNLFQTSTTCVFLLSVQIPTKHCEWSGRRRPGTFHTKHSVVLWWRRRRTLPVLLGTFALYPSGRAKSGVSTVSQSIGRELFSIFRNAGNFRQQLIFILSVN